MLLDPIVLKKCTSPAQLIKQVKQLKIRCRGPMELVEGGVDPEKESTTFVRPQATLVNRVLILRSFLVAKIVLCLGD